jgi:protein TonB
MVQPLRPVLPPPPPAPKPRPAPAHPTPSRPPAFPMPMNYSFGAPIRPQSKREPAHPATFSDLNMGPAAPGPMDATPFGEISGTNIGPDWRNALSAWVHDHAYYPEQAIRNDESGDSTVIVVANPDGRVTSVELERKSGSPWLDMALMALFRDARLPALPQDEDGPVTFHFTMRYILLHR